MTVYHFVGIKGSGMSALAQILHDAGMKVQGSDYEKHFFTQDALEQAGITILPFDENNITEGLTIIAGNAFPDTHPEIEKAMEMGLPVIRYHRFLQDYIENFTSIAITGAHGKTSTTGLMAHVLQGAKPTSYLIGDGTGRGNKEEIWKKSKEIGRGVAEALSGTGHRNGKLCSAYTAIAHYDWPI